MFRIQTKVPGLNTVWADAATGGTRIDAIRIAKSLVADGYHTVRVVNPRGQTIWSSK